MAQDGKETGHTDRIRHRTFDFTQLLFKTYLGIKRTSGPVITEKTDLFGFIAKSPIGEN